MSTNLPTVDECKASIENTVRTAFADHGSAEDPGAANIPQAIQWKRNSAGVVEETLLALALSVPAALATVKRGDPEIVAIAIEAWGEGKDDDIVAITIDHPEGIHVGRASVHKDGERIRDFEWTTTITPPDGRKFFRFPVFSMTGALLTRAA